MTQKKPSNPLKIRGVIPPTHHFYKKNFLGLTKNPNEFLLYFYMIFFLSREIFFTKPYKGILKLSKKNKKK